MFKDDNPALIANLAKEKLDSSFKFHLQVFTDGSRNDDKVGCAFYIPDLKITKQYRLNDGVSIFSAEMYAILMAVTYVTDMPHIIPNVVILSDSKSALQALKHPNRNRKGMIYDIHTLVHQLHFRGCHVQFQWVPSHVGICGNDMADKAAKESITFLNVSNNIGFTINEASTKIRKVLFLEWKNRYETNARTRIWTEFDLSTTGTFPAMSNCLLPLFYRLRGKTYKTRFSEQQCACNHNLSFDHLFICSEFNRNLIDLCPSLELSIMPQNRFMLLRKHQSFGWKITETFLQNIYRSSIGHLI